MCIGMFRRVSYVPFGWNLFERWKNLYGHVWEKYFKDHRRVLEEGPKGMPKTAHDSPTNYWQSTPCRYVEDLLVVDVRLRLTIGRGESKYKTQTQTTNQQDGSLVKGRVVVWKPSVSMSSCAGSLLSEGWQCNLYTLPNKSICSSLKVFWVF